jgi:tetratricopeptide (TPR) repeat protein
MKRIMFLILGIIAVALCVGYVRNTAREPSSAGTAESSVVIRVPDGRERLSGQPAAEASRRISSGSLTTSSYSSGTTVASVPDPQQARQPDQSTRGTVDPAAVSRAIETLVATNSSYGDKQAALRQLVAAGKLDEAIAALEQKHAAEPLVADFAATLGHAYLKKCGTTQDMREQAILAMQADKLFDTALNLDSSNWEARFTKAVAMSYWPANLNKGQEVIQNFQTLIQQQEVEPARPEFAETYLWLGDQLQKTGQRENAVAVWGRGASLFPTHDALRNRLAGAAQ